MRTANCLASVYNWQPYNLAIPSHVFAYWYRMEWQRPVLCENKMKNIRWCRKSGFTLTYWQNEVCSNFLVLQECFHFHWKNGAHLFKIISSYSRICFIAFRINIRCNDFFDSNMRKTVPNNWMEQIECHMTLSWKLTSFFCYTYKHAIYTIYL